MAAKSSSNERHGDDHGGFGPTLAAIRDRLEMTDAELVEASGLGRETIYAFLLNKREPTEEQVFRIAFAGLLGWLRLSLANRALQARGSTPVPGRRPGRLDNDEAVWAWADVERQRRLDRPYVSFGSFLNLIEEEGMTQTRLRQLMGSVAKEGALSRFWNEGRVPTEQLAMYIVAAVFLSPKELRILNLMLGWMDPDEVMPVPGEGIPTHAEYRSLRHRRRRTDDRWVRRQRPV